MSDLIIPLVLAVGGLIAAFAAYRGVRRGGARFYTLEREAILRRASFTIIGSAALFVFAIGLIVFQQQQAITIEATEEAAILESGQPLSTPTPVGIQFPPTDTPMPTVDVNEPTPTATAVICRAVVENTSFGLYLRDVPGGEEVDLLPEGSVVTLITSEARVESGGFTWQKVRAVGGDEGWVADDFLTVGAASGGMSNQ